MKDEKRRLSGVLSKILFDPFLRVVIKNGCDVAFFGDCIRGGHQKMTTAEIKTVLLRAEDFFEIPWPIITGND